jgi:SH3-like domain-containing protein
MRKAGWFGGVLATLACAGLAAAQTTAGDASIRVPRAEVRGRNSTIYPVTSVLRQGDPVHIVRPEGDEWLAITPPAGSSDWINDRYIQFEQRPAPGQPAWAYVQANDVPLLVGTPEPGVP